MVVLRPALRPDVPAVARVWEVAWHDGHRGHVPAALVQARDRAYFASRAVDLLDRVTVAEDDRLPGELPGELLGVLIVADDELQQLMVGAAARGRGVGGLLLKEAERQVAAAGHAEIWLAVAPGNVSARHFYESRGWVDRGEETYDAVTLGTGTGTGTVPVPVRRYVKGLDLASRQP